MGSRTNITAFDKHHFQLSSSSLTSFAIRKRRRPPKFSPSAVFLPPPPRGCRLTRHVRQDAISKKVLLSGWVRVFPFLFLFPFPSFAGGKSPPIETRFFAARLIYFFLSLSPSRPNANLDERVFLLPLSIPYWNLTAVSLSFLPPRISIPLICLAMALIVQEA